MDFLYTNAPVFIIILPFIACFLMPLFFKKKRIADTFLVSISSIQLLMAAYMALGIKDTRVYSFGNWPAPYGIELKIDSLAGFFVLTIASVFFAISLYSINSLRDEIGDDMRIVRFYMLMLLLTGALYGMALTNDIFNVYVLVEVATLSSCALVSSRKDPKAPYAAFNYLILATLGSTFITGGIAFVYSITGYLNMTFLNMELVKVWTSYPHIIWIAFSFFLVGFAVKSALFPMHIWLPNAHSVAPTPASAILSGLAVKGYIICFTKVLFNIFGKGLLVEYNINRIIRVMAMIAIIAGSILALSKDELKLRLAYSTVAQIGYIYLGISYMNAKGLSGSIFYIASHAVIKSCLFLSAGILTTKAKSKKIKDLSGLAKKMPITALAFTLSSLALIGIPLFSGFIGKWYLILGSFEAGSSLGVVAILVGSVLCAAYLLPVIRTIYFEPCQLEEVKDVGFAVKVSLISLSVLVVLLGIMPGPFLRLAESAALQLIGG